LETRELCDSGGKQREGAPSRSQVTPLWEDLCFLEEESSIDRTGKILLGIFWLSMENRSMEACVGDRTKICEVCGNEEVESVKMKRQQDYGWRHI
jgi:hypothetical protein